MICAAGAGLAPADRKLYALRDVTGTVEAIPLIASSIMSKKIAEGTGALVLDVKVGSGAFMKTEDSARELARTMVDLGRTPASRPSPCSPDMSTPLGLTAGNAIEVAESLEVLAGGGPPDVVELTVALAREMLAAAGRDGEDLAAALTDGRAMDTWRRMVAAQGGDPDAPLPTARESHTVLAPADGVLTRLDALAVGVAAWRLGAGRTRKEDAVQAGAGVDDARQAGCRRPRGGAAAHPAHRHPGPLRGRAEGPRRRDRGRARGVAAGPRPARPRPHRLTRATFVRSDESGLPAPADPGPGPRDGSPDERRPRGVFGVGEEPDARFSMANERTALAWVRTSLAVVAGGVGLTSVVQLADLSRTLDVLAGAMCLVGAWLAVSALLGWRRREIALRTGRPLPPPVALPWLAVAIVAVALVLAVVVVTGA